MGPIMMIMFKLKTISLKIVQYAGLCFKLDQAVFIYKVYEIHSK